MAAVEQARRQAGLARDSTDPRRVGLVTGSAKSSFSWWHEAYEAFYHTGDESRFNDRFSVLKGTVASPAVLAAIHSGIGGYLLTLSTTCISGHLALASCCDRIRLEEADVMYAVGHDFVVQRPIMASYAENGLLTREATNPKTAIKSYDLRRDGMTLGEGAIALTLESLAHAEARGAPIIAEVLGHHSHSGTGHFFRGDTTGQTTARDLTTTLEKSRRSPEDVSYICGHGTATPVNDTMEVTALNLLFGHRPTSDRPPLSAAKPIFGHVFGASALIDIAAVALAIKNKTIFPTANLSEPEIPYNHVMDEARPVDELSCALSMVHGFGGLSSVVCLSSLG
jgi:3-oxoacyl-[acyl-carrier-protein] synthase II